MTPTPSRFRLTLAIAAGVIVALALVAAGCGGGGSSSDASGTTATTSTTATPSSTGSNSAFAECLKENGVEGFEPGSAQQGGPPPQNVDPAALQKAMQACGSLRPQGQGFGGPGQNGQSSAQLAELQSCLKEHGIEGFSPGSAQSDADRQKLQDAMQACGAPGRRCRPGPQMAGRRVAAGRSRRSRGA